VRLSNQVVSLDLASFSEKVENHTAPDYQGRYNNNLFQVFWPKQQILLIVE